MPVMMPGITRLGFGAEILIDRDAEPGRLIDRHQHEHRQDRQAREFETRPAFLETDQGAREKRRSEPDGDIDYILGHARGFREATEPQNRLGAD